MSLLVMTELTLRITHPDPSGYRALEQVLPLLSYLSLASPSLDPEIIEGAEIVDIRTFRGWPGRLFLQDRPTTIGKVMSIDLPFFFRTGPVLKKRKRTSRIGFGTEEGATAGLAPTINGHEELEEAVAVSNAGVDGEGSFIDKPSSRIVRDPFPGVTSRQTGMALPKLTELIDGILGHAAFKELLPSLSCLSSTSLSVVPEYDGLGTFAIVTSKRQPLQSAASSIDTSYEEMICVVSHQAKCVDTLTQWRQEAFF
ncbi:hypothetical protein L218DRAFT_999170 [Marasmius fiardii PR-910]|nr:hypothetical protein L218DRAFT_999170 [Marasmius fiardii PR-910]